MASLAARRPYVPPPWVQAVPWLAGRAPPNLLPGLANLPTPVSRWELPESLLPAGFRLWIKRDDATGSELSGNKVRKLQFLLAEALEQSSDCVVTIGGEQSNHVRATALAARAVGLEPHLVLRTDTEPEDLGLAGNLLLDRLAGAQIYLASRSEWREFGSAALLERVGAALRLQGRRPYVIPVGGSNSTGTWGYLEAVHELQQQLGHDGLPATVSDIVMATGSGGTAGGVALGVHLAGLGARVHAFSVSDSPEYFYDLIQKHIVQEMAPAGAVPPSTQLVQIRDAKGLGYAVSDRGELELIAQVARHSGVVVDPVYSGKALGACLRLMREEPAAFAGRDVLFWHTGGIFGVFDKAQELAPLLSSPAVCRLPQSTL